MEWGPRPDLLCGEGRGSFSRSRGRKSEEERTPYAECAFHPNSPAVRFDESLGDGEAESSAAMIALVPLPELVEQMSHVCRRNPGSTVLHLEENLRTLAHGP